MRRGRSRHGWIVADRSRSFRDIPVESEVYRLDAQARIAVRPSRLRLAAPSEAILKAQVLRPPALLARASTAWVPRLKKPCGLCCPTGSWSLCADISLVGRPIRIGLASFAVDCSQVGWFKQEGRGGCVVEAGSSITQVTNLWARDLRRRSAIHFRSRGGELSASCRGFPP